MVSGAVRSEPEMDVSRSLDIQSVGYVAEPPQRCKLLHVVATIVRVQGGNTDLDKQVTLNASISLHALPLLSS